MAYTRPTAHDFIARFPEFETMSDDDILRFIIDAEDEINTAWNDAEKAVLFLAAHFVISAAQQSEGGRISSIGLGPISLSFANGVQTVRNSDVSTSEYGRRFALIRSRNCGGPLVV